MLARILSFALAATVTWRLNRRFTFVTNARATAAEWARYFALTGLGASVNYGVYTLWILSAGVAPVDLFVGVVLGSGVGLVFNFLVLKYIVFRPARGTRAVANINPGK